MRDSSRIQPFLDKFQKVWEDNPDLRFGQLVMILVATMPDGKDFFQCEEEEWEHAMELLTLKSQIYENIIKNKSD